jgi:hypothetical protein
MTSQRPIDGTLGGWTPMGVEVLRMRNSWGSCLAAALPLVLGACSGSVVDLGGEQGEDEQGGSGVDGPVCDRYGIATGDFYVGTYDALRKLENCREIRGNLSITPLDVPDLTPLGELRVVEGTLVLGAYTALSVEDAALTWPGFVIVPGEGEPIRLGNEVPEGQVFFPSLAGLGSLESADSLELHWIGSADLSELTSLRTVAERVLIGSAPALSDLNGLDGVEVGGLLLSDVPELVSIGGFELPADRGMTTLSIDRAPKLVDLTALVPLEWVTAPINLVQTGLQDLGGLAGLRFAGAGIHIVQNPELIDVTALDGLESTTILELVENPKLLRLPRFPTLRFIESLIINGNDALEEVVLEMPELTNSGLGRRTSADMWRLLQVDGNPGLRRLVVPRRALSVDEVYVRSNESLSELDLGGLTIMDMLFISRNAALSIVQAPYIRRVAELTVNDNPLLSLAPFADVETFVSNLGGNADELAP